ncbi:hypothetical protein [Saccharospirillum impatiens]|uniref:hypothetical protein n=1 Tax=Saccharospirillum impatiens TaxID=169438 RepID=UPI00040711A3|nr:hypothetical protein [Saccharospirillum impatiens]
MHTSPLIASTLFGTALLLFSFSAHAKTALIDMEDARSGGFGGPVVKLGTVNGDNAVMIGGEGGATFTSGAHSLIIGGAGYGLVNELEWDDTGRKLEMGYAGLLMGYTHQPDRVVHWESKVLLGAGNVSIVDSGGSNDEDANFLVSEFSLSGEVNVTDFLEIGIGGAYRLTSEPLIDNLDAGDISGPSVFISFQFGQI